MISFFWATDGQKLACVRFEATERRLAWWVVDTDGRQPRRVTRFTPTRDELFMLTYFDQFAQALTPWSPDGWHLVFVEASRAGDHAGLLSIATVENGQVRQFGAATSATWSRQ